MGRQQPRKVRQPGKTRVCGSSFALFAIVSSHTCALFRTVLRVVGSEKYTKRENQLICRRTTSRQNDNNRPNLINPNNPPPPFVEGRQLVSIGDPRCARCESVFFVRSWLQLSAKLLRVPTWVLSALPTRPIDLQRDQVPSKEPARR